MSEKEFEYDEMVSVFSAERYESSDWPPEDAEGFVGWVQKKLWSIPAEHRASARIVLECSQYYESTQVKIEITYKRPPTAQEIANRRRQYDAHRAQQIAFLERRLRAMKGDAG